MTPAARVNGRQPPVAHVAVFLVGLVLCLALALVNHLRGFILWRNYALAGFFMGALVTYILWRLDVRVPSYVQAVVLASALAHWIGGSLGAPGGPPYRMGLLGMHGINGAYHVFGWYDHFTHLLGIAGGAMGYAYLLDVYQVRRGLRWNGPALWVVAVLAALATGVAMELYEYLGKTVFATIDQGGYVNTMQDLHYNMLGALVGASIAVTVNRTAFRRHIRARWDIDRVPPAPGGWFQRLPPRMAGLVVAVTIPALTSVALGIRFFFVHIPDPDLPLYDPALNALTVSAVAGVMSFPLVTLVQRRIMGRMAPSTADPDKER